MNDLTTKELGVLNNVSRVLSPEVSLGQIIQTLISGNPVMLKFGDAVNARRAIAGGILFTGDVKVGETFRISKETEPNPRIHIFKFVAEGVPELEENEISVDIAEFVASANGILTMDTQPISGDKVTIGTKVYTFVPVGTDTADGEVSIGGNLGEAQENLVAAINGTDEFNVAHPDVVAGLFSDDQMAIIAKIAGTDGNSIATTETFTAETNVFGDVTLGEGEDCPADDAMAALIFAINSEEPEGYVRLVDAGLTEEEGFPLLLTSVLVGEDGNNIEISSTVENCNLPDEIVNLDDGEDATISSGPTVMIGESVYICLDAVSVMSEDGWVLYFDPGILNGLQDALDEILGEERPA
jgi:hypothetical protein